MPVLLSNEYVLPFSDVIFNRWSLLKLAGNIQMDIPLNPIDFPLLLISLKEGLAGKAVPVFVARHISFNPHMTERLAIVILKRLFGGKYIAFFKDEGHKFIFKINNIIFLLLRHMHRCKQNQIRPISKAIQRRSCKRSDFGEFRRSYSG